MKKYLLLVLCLCMLCTTLTGCGKSRIEEAEDILNNTHISKGREKVTLNFYLMSESAVSPVALSEMQNQFNKIIEAKYNTHVVFTIVTAEEYDAVLAARMADAEKKVEGSVPLEGTDYPAIKNKQLDIFLNTSYASLKDNVQKGNLADISALLASKWREFSNAKAEKEIINDKGAVIATYNPTISEVLMSSSFFCTELYADDSVTTAERSEVYYGIPCSYPVGEYKYLVVHKEYADRFFLADNFKADISVLADKEKAQAAKSKLEAEITKLGQKPNDYIKEVVGNYEYRVDLQFDDNGTEYYVCVLEKPSISYEDICSAMFCISKYTANLERSFEVLYELNVNPELHTILQYGAQGVNYNFDARKQNISLIAGAPEYNINLKYTGNYFCIYPIAPEDKNLTGYEALKNANLQNADATCKGVVIHKSYLTRDTLGKYIFGMYDSALAAGGTQTQNGLVFQMPIGEKTVTYKDNTYSVLYRGERTTDGKSTTLIMEATLDGVKTVIKIKATPIESGYSFKLDYEADGVTFSSAEFSTLPNGNKYLFDYTFVGAEENYKGTMTVSASDFSAGTKLSIDKQTITITQDKEASIEQIQEVDAAINMIMGEFLSALDMFMVDAGKDLDVSAFGFILSEE